MQILPAIDLRAGKCVRLRQGDYEQETVFNEDPVAQACAFADAGAERLHLVDLDGAKAGEPVNLEVVGRIVAANSIPCQIGGGVRSEQSIRVLLETVGVDRVIIGTKALREPEWFRAMCDWFPNKLALGLDARDGKVAAEGWLETSSTSALDLAKKLADLPIAAIIYTNIANDGMMQGLDSATLKDLRALAELGPPIIASGGVTTVEDVRSLREIELSLPNLAGAIIGRALYEGTLSLTSALQEASARPNA